MNLRAFQSRRRRRLAVVAGALIGLAIAAAAAYAALSPTSTAEPVALETDAGVAAIDPAVGNVVDLASLQLAGASGKASFFVGSGKSPGYECLVVVILPSDATVGCEKLDVINKQGAYVGGTESDGTTSGAVLLPTGTESVSANGSPTTILGGRVVAFSTKSAIQVVATTPSGSVKIAIPAIPYL